MPVDRSVEGVLENLNLEADEFNLTLGDVETLLTQIRDNLGDHTDGNTIEVILESVLNSVDDLEGDNDTIIQRLTELRDNLGDHTDANTIEQILENSLSTLNTIDANTDTVETKLQSVIDNTDQLDLNTDDIETILTNVRDNLGDHTDANTIEGILESILANVDELEGLVRDNDVQAVTNTVTGTDMNFATSIGADHEIEFIGFDRDSTEEIEIEIGVRNTSTSTDFAMVKETSSTVNDVVITDVFQQTANQEIYITTTGVTTGATNFEVSYTVND